MEQTSYVKITDQLTGKVIQERHAMTCGHCSRVIHAPANAATASLDQVSKTCACCRRRVCLTKECVSRCVPIERKIAAYERRAEQARARDELCRAVGTAT